MPAINPESEPMVSEGVERAPVELMVVEAEPPNDAVVPVTREEKDELVVVALVVVEFPTTTRLPLIVEEAVKSAPANVGVDAVVRCWPVLKANCESPIESPTISMVSPEPKMACPAVTEI